MQKRKSPALIAPVLQTLAKNFGLEKGMAVYALKKKWPELVGETIAAHTEPEKMRFSTLTLRVDGAAWMHELTFLKAEIIQKLNKALGSGSIQTLYLRMGALSPQIILKKKTSTASLKPLSEEESEFFNQQLSSVRDDALKQIISKAMQKHLI